LRALRPVPAEGDTTGIGVWVTVVVSGVGVGLEGAVTVLSTTVVAESVILLIVEAVAEATHFPPFTHSESKGPAASLIAFPEASEEYCQCPKPAYHPNSA